MNKRKLKSAAHILAGLLVLSQAFAWFEKDDISLSVFYFACGVIFIMVAGSTKAVKRNFLFNGGVFFLVEGLVLLLSARDLLLQRKTGKGYFFVLIGFCFIVFAFNSINRKRLRR